ncbi:MAG: type III-A CRISPR-associated protein Cas10/Csm1 [Erysipelotrichaceae bacterium]|nr:type III-A CRISPR-associated protein Cas10/Csm1 [Erysipelotrichaceae bacterium]
MNQKAIEAAYGALLHDIGKFYQRTYLRSDLSKEERSLCRFNPAGYYSHLHSGYTSRFLRESLKLYNEFEKTVSEHHQPYSIPLSKWIVQADHIASRIDRSDEDSDTEEQNNRNKRNFQTIRLSSVFSLLDFGKPKTAAGFSLRPLSDGQYPSPIKPNLTREQSVEEYSQLFDDFSQKVKEQGASLQKAIDRNAFDHMYGILQEYTTSIPASTFEGNDTFVSLFDHLKLTAAIASCLAIGESETFHMLEFDVSGIQNFIFKVFEGKESQGDIAKSLRGRSLFVSLITDYLMYSYLNAFDLTQANIIFQTGGGALLLLPDVPHYEQMVEELSHHLLSTLFELFHTDLTFVWASISLNAKELEGFKAEKAIDLKAMLEEQKRHKFSQLIDEAFFYEAPSGQKLCPLCQSMTIESSQEYCFLCDQILTISDFYIKNPKLYLEFSFGLQKRTDAWDTLKDNISIQIGDCTISLLKEPGLIPESGVYVETVNAASIGITRYLANLAPAKNGKLLPLDEICKLPGDSFGDPKLGILKMDVDNLGSIFAYGLSGKTRSLSKYLTLSRLIEIFFGMLLPKLCQEVSIPYLKANSDKVDNGTVFYINYAGGDDLVILGPAAAILDLADAINKQFNAYTKNDNLTISAGIFIQRPKQPVRFGIHHAEEYLNRSKDLPNKNGVTLLDSTWPASVFNEILVNAKAFKADLEADLISRSNFYHLMTALDTEDLEVFYKNLPVILYNLKRNIEKKNDAYRKKWVARLSAIQTYHDLPKLKQLCIEMKLAIMMTREIKS